MSLQIMRIILLLLMGPLYNLFNNKKKRIKNFLIKKQKTKKIINKKIQRQPPKSHPPKSQSQPPQSQPPQSQFPQSSQALQLQSKAEQMQSPKPSKH